MMMMVGVVLGVVVVIVVVEVVDQDQDQLVDPSSTFYPSFGKSPNGLRRIVALRQFLSKQSCSFDDHLSL